MKWFILGLVPGMLSVSCLAQEGESILSRFNIRQLNNTIVAEFTIEAGTSSCNGIELERSTSGTNQVFEVIGIIPGICGESEFEESYLLVDNNPPANDTIYYRLNMGNIGKSEVLPFVFVEFTGEITIYPNPSAGLVNLRFENNENLSCNVTISSPEGRIIVSQDFSSAFHVKYQLDDFSPGLYLCTITTEDNVQRNSSFILR